MSGSTGLKFLSPSVVLVQAQPTAQSHPLPAQCKSQHCRLHRSGIKMAARQKTGFSMAVGGFVLQLEAKDSNPAWAKPRRPATDQTGHTSAIWQSENTIFALLDQIADV